ncbi:hypothetical protein B5S28_g2489 [[Candida] boidinii]|nr:hypothetical protein B5S28_g2489 [[Candida] boidinii]
MQERRNIKQSYGPPKRTTPSSYPIKLEALETFKNRILVNEYLDTIIQHLQTSERNSEITPSMIDLQPEVKWFMRPYLVNFIIQMHSSLKLKPQTLFLCWNIIDRYCAKRIAFRQHYQLIGCTALWIASKYEDKKSRVPTITELSLMCNNVYEESMFKEMEMHILSTLNWCIGHTSVEDILQISIKLSNHDGKESVMQLNPNNLLLERGNSPTVSGILAISRYLCELSLYDRCYLNFKPSMIAITAHLIACSILSITTGVKSLESTFTEYLVDQLNFMVLNKSQPNHTSHNSNLKNNIPRTFVNDDEIFYDDEDEFVDDDDVSNRENCDPLNNKIYGAFISGFHGSDTIKQIRTISILLFRSMNNPPEVLIEKYTPLGVINAVNNFFNEYFNLFKSLSKNLNLSNNASANNNSEYNEQVISNFFPLSGLNQSSNPYAIELSDYLLGLPTNMEQKIENSVYPKKSSNYPSTTLLDSPISSATTSSFNTPPSQPYRNKSFVTDSSPSSPSNFSSFSSVSSQTNYSSDTLSEPTNNSFVLGTTATIFSDVTQKKIPTNKAGSSFYQQQQQAKQFRNIISNANTDFNKSRSGSTCAESTYTLQQQQQQMQQYHTEAHTKPTGYNSASYPSSSTITNNSSETDMGDQSSEGGNSKLPNSSPFSTHSGEKYDNRNANNDIMV